MTAELAKLTYLAVIPFLAEDDEEARFAVASYAEGLTMLRPEVDCYRAGVQRVDDPIPTEVFCGTPGPDVDQCCVDIAGHGEGTLHHDSSGDQWSDAEVPAMPDSPEDLDP